MLEVFFCTMDMPNDEMREQMSNLCLRRWYREDVRVNVISPNTIGCRSDKFQLERRKFADLNALNPVYVLADDDCLITKDFDPAAITDAAKFYFNHHGFITISLMPSNANIVPWTPEGYSPFTDSAVMEHVSVGGVRFCRKGAIAEWPAQHGSGYDSTHGAVARNLGFRVGYFHNYRMNHIGEGYSTVWR